MKKTLKYKDLKVGEVFRLKKVGRDFGLHTAVFQKNCEAQSTIVDKAKYHFPKGSIVDTYDGMTHTIWQEADVILVTEPILKYSVKAGEPVLFDGCESTFLRWGELGKTVQLDWNDELIEVPVSKTKRVEGYPYTAVTYNNPRAAFIKARDKKLAKRNDMLKNEALDRLEELFPKKKGKKK